MSSSKTTQEAVSPKPDFKSIVSPWKGYYKSALHLKNVMGGTANYVGEFAERLVCEYYGVEKPLTNQKSFDFITKNGEKIQVKSRTKSGKLNIIRSWDFDILVVILFSPDGNVLKAVKIKKEHAKNLSNADEHQNGQALTTSKVFNNSNASDITDELNKIIRGEDL
ncbi:MAG: hypothetical protein FWE23_02810 [Chitinivibrionia bacterium]|nr:hypothetical protein [Chitinivibrionia bacterium]